MKEVRKSSKKIVKFFMVLSLLFSYSMPIVSHAEEIFTESSHESEETIHSRESSAIEESQSELNESSHSLEPNESFESKESFESTYSTNNEEEHIEKDRNSDLEKESKNQVESEEQVEDDELPESSKDESKKDSEIEVIEIKNMDYEAEIVIGNIDLFSVPGNSTESERLGTTSDYLNRVVTVVKEAHTETQAWANIMLEDKEFGWVNIEALEKKDQEQITTFSMAKDRKSVV